MKRISSLLFLWMLMKSASGQIDDFLPETWHVARKPSDSIAAFPQQPRFSCQASMVTASRDVLVVIDGLIRSYEDLEKLNSNEISSIDILRYDKMSGIYCNAPRKGVIVINTKSANQCKLVIRDFLDGKPIPNATVCIFNRGDSIKTVADDNGVVIIDKLTIARPWRVIVSSSGYRSLSVFWVGKVQELFLERDVKKCDEVTVKTIVCRRRVNLISFFDRHLECIAKGMRTADDSLGSVRNEKTTGNSLFRLYPNPVPRCSQFNIEWISKENEVAQLSVVDMSGTTVFRQLARVNAGRNQISVMADGRWPAGIYNIQLRNDNGTLVRQEKIIVQ